MRKLNGILKFELMKGHEDLGELIEHIGVEDWELWLAGTPLDKKETTSFTADVVTLKVIDYLIASTYKDRARSQIINSLLILGIKEFYKRTSAYVIDDPRY